MSEQEREQGEVEGQPLRRRNDEPAEKPEEKAEGNEDDAPEVEGQPLRR